MVNENTKPQINIPRADENEVAIISKGILGNIDEKFKKIDGIIFGVIMATILALMALIISVIGLFLEQFRFNSTVYKEYSDKTKSLEILQDTNKQLLEENRQNQNIIIEQQKQINDGIKKQ